MKASYIKYNETGYFSSTVLSYLEQDARLKPFYSYTPDLAGFENLITNKKVRADRQVLVSVLKEQYSSLGNEVPKAVEENINLLLDDNCFTVTTGHQLNLFTGPLYFLYKIVTAINLAETLKKRFPGKSFVPVYWMATEDHDFAEINHTQVHGKRIEWSEPAKGATGRLSTANIAGTVKEYLNTLGLGPHSEELRNIIQKAYLEHPSLAAATRYLVNALFGKYGLIVVDADSRALKQTFASVMEADITGANSFRAINATSKALEDAGFSTQVHAREINFFYLKEELRERIIKDGDEYYVLNSDYKFTEEEIRREIREYPERFSPNVIMRPLYQEFILPNLAYIGGGAELVYWLQLKQNFEYYETDLPVLLLRNSALITDDKFSDRLCRLGLTEVDIFKKTETLKTDWVKRNSGHNLTLTDEWKEFGSLFEKIKLRAYKIDPTLSPSTEAVKARLHKAISNLEKKLVRAEKKNHENSLSQIQKIRDKYFPNESLQERTENFGPLYIQFGAELIEALLAAFHPLDSKFMILEA